MSAMSDLNAVVETAAYLAKASRILTDIERARIVDVVASRPDGGVILGGSKGLRKMRIALAGRGKSSGGRIIYWYHSPGFPVVLLWVFAKNEADNLTAAQLKRLVSEADWLIEDFGGAR
jgi:hypothetical protein